METMFFQKSVRKSNQVNKIKSKFLLKIFTSLAFLLDAYMAIGLVEIMYEQARLGKTIICTIHQPSTQIYEKFDT